MTTQLRRDARDEATRKLLHFLDLEVNAEAGYEAASQNLALARLLETLGCDSVGRIIFFRRTIPLLICGVDSVAEPDFCLLKGDAILLMVQRRSSLNDPEPFIIAAAIAAYNAITSPLSPLSLFPPSRLPTPTSCSTSHCHS